MYAFKITCWASIIRIVERFFLNKKNTALTEVTKIKDSANENTMIINIFKTWEMLLSKAVLKQLPQIDGIKSKEWPKLLGEKFYEDVNIILFFCKSRLRDLSGVM